MSIKLWQIISQQIQTMKLLTLPFILRSGGFFLAIISNINNKLVSTNRRGTL